MPSRILDRPTGGNTTYARHIARGLSAQGIRVKRIAAGSHPIATMAFETAAGLARARPGEVLHYVADTGPLVRTRRPSVVTVHGVASRWISDARTPQQESIWRGRVRRAISSTDRVITVSRSSARDISTVFGVEQSRIEVIEHGIDTQAFSEPTPISEELRAKLPAEFALYLGNIEPRKNLIPLVQAFGAPSVTSLEVPLIIAGRPAWNSDEIVRSIDDAPNVIRIGYVSDTDRVALMQAASLFVFPSLYEGFGFPVLEALAAGAVVLTSDRGSLADVAGPALRFPSLSVDEMAGAIVDALTNSSRRNDCVEKGREWASRFTWSESIERHIKVYEDLV